MASPALRFLYTKVQTVLRERFNLVLERRHPGLGEQEGRFPYQSKWIDFGLKGDERVLDVGSGRHPFPHATHLLDRYSGATSHRTGKLVIDRPTIIGAIEKLPFADKSFDFVYCSHVLEHVEDPAQACEELMRVGLRGYIETPAKISDVMLNFTRIENHHRWHVNLVGNTLVFIEWDQRERRDLGSSHFYSELHSPWQNPFQDFVHKNRDLFVNMMLWEHRFDYLVITQQGQIRQYSRLHRQGTS